MDVVELNEAFAAQAMAVERDLMLDHGRVNLDGGAIALGHPLGASGARITGKAASLLARTGGRHALATMCVGGGQGVARHLRRERVRGVHQHVNRLVAQVAHQPLHAAEPAPARGNGRQRRRTGPARQGQHRLDGRVARQPGRDGGRFRGAAQDQDLHAGHKA